MNTSKVSRNYIKCANPVCGNRMSQYPDVSYFTFPKDPTRCLKWIEHCGLKIPVATMIKKHLRLCGKHFETKMFLNDLRNRLHNHAVPSLFANSQSVSDVNLPSVPLSNASTGTENKLSVLLGNSISRSLQNNLCNPYFDHSYSSQSTINSSINCNSIARSLDNNLCNPYIDHSYSSQSTINCSINC